MSLLTSQIGIIITLIFGIWAILQPTKFSKLISLTPYKNTGVTEIRATYGGFISGLAIFGLLNQTPLVFQCIAFAWFGAALMRSIGIVIDKSDARKGIMFISIEIIVGILLMI